MSVRRPLLLRWPLLTPPDATLLDDDVVVEAPAIDLDLSKGDEAALHDRPHGKSCHGPADGASRWEDQLVGAIIRVSTTGPRTNRQHRNEACCRPFGDAVPRATVLLQDLPSRVGLVALGHRVMVRCGRLARRKRRLHAGRPAASCAAARSSRPSRSPAPSVRPRTVPPLCPRSFETLQ